MAEMVNLKYWPKGQWADVTQVVCSLGEAQALVKRLNRGRRVSYIITKTVEIESNSKDW